MQQTPAPAGSGAMFDGIAPRYDLLNRLISLGVDQGWRRRTVRALRLEGAGDVLDLAAGTGDLALLTARTHSRARITCADPSRAMLALCRGKIAAAGLQARMSALRCVAERLPFPDGSFDGVTMAFGIRNVPDRAAALREIARVLRPGGRMALLELSEPQRGALAPLARFHVHTVVPFLGGLLSGSREYRYLQRSIAAFPPPAQFAARVGESGLEVEEVVALTFGVAAIYVARRPFAGAPRHTA